MPQSWICRWYFRIHSENDEQFQPNKFGGYQLPQTVFHIQCNGYFNCRCSHERSNMAPQAKPNINPYLMDLSVVPNLFGTKIFQPNKFGCYQGHKAP